MYVKSFSRFNTFDYSFLLIGPGRNFLMRLISSLAILSQATLPSHAVTFPDAKTVPVARCVKL